jgi:hypothetical protein
MCGWLSGLLHYIIQVLTLALVLALALRLNRVDGG